MKEIRIKGKKGEYYVQFLNDNRRWENELVKLPIGIYVQITYSTKKKALNKSI
jgi:hypothetical protein